jgi:endonuclease YncB( thermonuclease family)
MLAEEFVSLAKRSLLVLGLALPYPRGGLVPDLPGQGIRTLDGNAIEALYNGNAERIRLKGIDCSEKGQAYGKKVNI